MNNPSSNDPAPSEAARSIPDNASTDPTNPYSTPVEFSTPATPTNQGDVTGGVIPYKNPAALTAYYLGVVSLIPVIGIPFGFAAIILGIIGLRNRSRNPVVKGSAHAIVGIVCGSLALLCTGVITIVFVIQALGSL